MIEDDDYRMWTFFEVLILLVIFLKKKKYCILHIMYIKMVLILIKDKKSVCTVNDVTNVLFTFS